MRMHLEMGCGAFGAAILLASPVAHLTAQNVQASLTALVPITANWVTAPPGTIGAMVSHPAGPLTSASISMSPQGMGGHASFACDLAQMNGVWLLHATSDLYTAITESAYIEADLLLTLSAATDTVATLGISMTDVADFPYAGGFRVDVGNDGSVEVDSHQLRSFGERIRHAVLDFAGGPVEVRVTSDNVVGYPPSAYWLELTIEQWSSYASPEVAACGALAGIPPAYPHFETDYFLEVVPPGAPGNLGAIRAYGLGDINWFLAGLQSSTVPLLLPPPFPAGTCPVLSGISIIDAGAITASWPGGAGQPWAPRAWQIPLPLLPPGLTFYMQHGSVWIGTLSVGTSNVVRIDS